jgi:small subunit ribosomal protein S16
MVKLRLRRRGRKKAPFYDIVAIDGRARRDGASIERVGFIDPMTTPKSVTLNVDRALYWLGVGAQPTEVVRQILSREGVLLRRHLALKGHSEAEIEAAILTHRERSAAAWKRRQELRAKRAAAKIAAANAPAAEEAAPAADAPVADGPAEETPAAE